VRTSYSSLPDAVPDHPLAVAHRHGNLVELVGLAAAAGVDMLEMDVFGYRGRLEVRHARRLGPWMLEGWHLHRSQGRPLLLAEVLAALPADAALMVDLKGRSRWAAAAIADLMSTVIPGRAYAVCGRRWSMLEPFEAVPQARVVWSAGSRRELRRLRLRLQQAPAWGVSVRRQLLTPALVGWLLERVRVVMAWHVEDAARLEQVLRLGVNGIICEDLAVLGTLLEQRVDITRPGIHRT
jgi:glycerophosphoryl diester phosphodiesterase